MTKTRTWFVGFIVAALFFLVFLATPDYAYAVELPCVPSNAENSQNDVFNCVNRLYRIGLVASTVAAVFMIILAGYLYIFSGGNEKRVGTAKGFVNTSLIGLAILIVGYLVLQQINPQILQVRNISLGTMGKSDWYTYDPSKFDAELPGDGGSGSGGAGGGKCGERCLGSYSGGDGSKPGANQTWQELKCSFDSAKQKNEIPKLTSALYNIVKDICASVPGARISSVIGVGKHSDNSLHYSGCAIDFGNDTFTSEGKKIMEYARSKGLVVNPGSDAKQTYHVHISLGSYCGKSGS